MRFWDISVFVFFCPERITWGEKYRIGTLKESMGIFKSVFEEIGFVKGVLEKRREMRLWVYFFFFFYCAVRVVGKCGNCFWGVVGEEGEERRGY